MAFAHELPRLDVHGAAIELERKIKAGVICEGEREDAIGNNADGQSVARGFERHARMEGRVLLAGLFGKIGKEIVMIDECRRPFGAAGEFEADHGLGSFNGVRKKLRRRS